MVPAFTRLDSAQSDSRQKYWQLIESLYYPVVIHFLQKNDSLLHLEQLQQSLTEPQHLSLKRQQQKLKLSQSDSNRIKQEVGQALLIYVQEVKHVQNYRCIEIQRGILEYEQERLGISRDAANAIIKEVIQKSDTSPPSNPHYQQNLKKYDEILASVIRKGLPIDTGAAWELRRLQQVLDLEDKDLPPPEQLRSARGINYIPLWRTLRARRWKDACEETCKRMVEIAGQREAHYLQTDAQLFPCTDLQTIDDLWLRYSNNHFGFSIQQGIWQELQGDLCRFGRRVGWYRNNIWLSYEDMNFSLQAERGHLPVFGLMGWWCWAGGMKAMVEQFGTCPPAKSRPPQS